MRTEDGHIIHKCLGGDAAAFGLLVDKYRASVYALAYTKLGNFHDAEDVTQEVFLKAYQKLRTLKRWDRFLSWLYAITSNLCKDFSRSRSNRPDTEYVADQKNEHLDRLSMESYHETEVYQSLHETLAALPDIHRQVLTLHYLGGMSYREMAQFLGTSPHAIAMRLNRARSKLKTEMLTLMKTSCDQQKLQPAFTLNIVEIIQRIRIQSNPRTPAIPVGVAAVSLLTLLCLTATFNPFQVLGSLVGAPLTSETKITKVGEIPTEVIVLAETSILSSGDNKKDLAGNPQPADGIQAANTHIEVKTVGRDEPFTRLGNSGVHTIAYSPDGKRIAVMGALGIWLYDANTLSEVGVIEDSARAIAFSPDGQILASGGWTDPDRTVHLWNMSTQEEVGSLRLIGPRGVNAIAFAPDGNTLAVGYGFGDIALWDMETQRLMTRQTVAWDTPVRVPWKLAFSPDGQLLAGSGHAPPFINLQDEHEAPFISLWEVPTLELVGSFEGHSHDTRQPNYAVSSIAFSPEGTILASGSDWDYTVRLWDVATRRQIAMLLENKGDAGDEAINVVSFSPDGTILASGGDDGKIRLWDVKTRTQIDVLDTNAGGVSSIAFHPDGKTLTSLNGSQYGQDWHKWGDMAVRLWDVATRKQIAMSQNHTAATEAVALSPDGALLASGHRDGVVGLWNMQTQKLLTTLPGHTAVVQSVAFSPDGLLLASGEKEYTRLWGPNQKAGCGLSEALYDCRVGCV